MPSFIIKKERSGQWFSYVHVIIAIYEMLTKAGDVMQVAFNGLWIKSWKFRGWCEYFRMCYNAYLWNGSDTVINVGVWSLVISNYNVYSWNPWHILRYWPKTKFEFRVIPEPCDMRIKELCLGIFTKQLFYAGFLFQVLCIGAAPSNDQVNWEIFHGELFLCMFFLCFYLFCLHLLETRTDGLMVTRAILCFLIPWMINLGAKKCI